jgi:RNA polymerase sigma-70 factor (ECF subfamily)
LDPAQATERFYEILWPHRDSVLRTATLLTQNAAEADDLAQETMLKAFKAIDQFREGTDAKAWLMAILRNARVDRLRAAGASAHTLSLDELELEPPDRPHPEGQDGVWQNPEEILDSFSDEEVIDVLGRLPEQIRWTLLLVDVEGLDQKEAAEVLQVPVGTIKSRAHRGRLMIREALLPLARQRRLVE